MKNNIESIVKSQFAEYFNISVDEVTIDRDIKTFNADSLDVVQLGTNLELGFDIDFTFEKVREFKTIDDICKYIESELNDV